jgi:hypothetical protein
MNSSSNRGSTEGTATNQTHPAGRTLTTPENPEPHMSTTPQPTETPPGRGRERAFIAACAIITIAAIIGIVMLLTRGDQPARTGPRASLAPTADTPSSSPVPATAEDIAAEEAKSRFLEYSRVEDLIGQGGYDNPELYDSVLIDPLNTQFKLAARRTPEGQRTTGEVKVVSLIVQDVHLPSDPLRNYPEVRLVACLDVSGTDAVDADGNSIVPLDRLARIKSEVLLQKIPREAFASVGDDRPAGWYISELVQRGEPC